jgi:hypothetical protein
MYRLALPANSLPNHWHDYPTAGLRLWCPNSAQFACDWTSGSLAEEERIVSDEPKGQTREAPEQPPTFDAVAMAKRRWQVAKNPDLREQAVVALRRIGRLALRELRRFEVGNTAVPPALVSAATKPWEALLDHATEQEQVRFAREQLDQARRLVARVQALKRRA